MKRLPHVVRASPSTAPKHWRSSGRLYRLQIPLRSRRSGRPAPYRFSEIGPDVSLWRLLLTVLAVCAALVCLLIGLDAFLYAPRPFVEGSLWMGACGGLVFGAIRSGKRLFA